MSGPAERVRRVVGCMTGTSLDGIDAALLEISGEGLQMRCRFVHGVSDELGPIKQQLRDMAEQVPMTAGQIATLAREFSLLHARVVRQLLAGQQADLICVHGQTVFHKPPVSWQLFEPGPLVHATQTPVVFNLRQADLARRGQGAPITPVADGVLFFANHRSSAGVGIDAIVNLGGFCNVTERMSGDYRTGEDTMYSGRDLCACNHVLDFIAREYMRMPFDADGSRAMQGVVREYTLHEFSHALLAQSRGNRSLGTGDELSQRIASYASRMSPEDLAATACHAIAQAVHDAMSSSVEWVVLAGGGVKNAALMQAFAQRFRMCQTTQVFGIPPEYREAACFAVLGALCQDDVSIYVQDQRSAGHLAIAGNWAFASPCV